jgi:class 3 adenylate cyclase
MDSNYKPYDHLASFKRIDDILSQPDVNYEAVKQLPDRDRLTYSNGFYAYCSAMFVDIRGSSGLPAKYKRPTLARLYRAYISEVVAVMNGDLACREINIVGDGVWCVVNTPSKSNINDVFSTACKINELIDVLNCKLEKRGIDPIRIGLGIEYGRALMVKAGYSGSGINDVVYMGEVVNRAAKLAAQGGTGGPFLFVPPMMIGDTFAQNLNDHNMGLLSWDAARSCWTSNAYNVAMHNWRLANCP